MLPKLFRKREWGAGYHAFITPTARFGGSRVDADRERMSWHEIDALPLSEGSRLRASDMAETNLLCIN